MKLLNHLAGCLVLAVCASAAWAADTVKLSQLPSVGVLNTTTDKAAGTRNGNTSVQFSFGTLAAQSGTFSGSSSGTNTGDVTLAGENYLSRSNQVITANSLNLSGTNVTSTLPGARGGTGVSNSSGTLTWGGNVTFSGAHTFTGTLTANTAVTFPTSGTLAAATGSPSTGNLAKFSSASTLTNGDMSGDCTTTGTLALTCGYHSITGALKNNGSGTVTQAACSDLSNGATGCSTATGTSGATLPLLNGTNTWSGAQSFNSGDMILKGASSGAVTVSTAAAAGTWTMMVPTSAGTNKYPMTTDGSGQLTLANQLDLTAAVTGVLPIANGGTNDSGTAWTAYTPTVTAGTGTLTTKSATGRYKTIGKTCFYEMAVTITTNGTGANYIAASLPFTAAAFEYEASARNSSTPFIQMAYIPASTATVIILKIDGTYPAIDGTVLQVTGVFETN